MTSLKKLIRMAKKWQKLAGRNQKRVLFPRNNGDIDAESCNTSSSSSMADKGHSYLENSIIRKLFIMAEAEFGLPSSGHITLPCDAVFMKYAISSIKRCPEKDVEKALLMSLTTVLKYKLVLDPNYVKARTIMRAQTQAQIN
ncbi:hypothetical protein ACOSP7_031572 [Xanthoceras sorbifolium]